MNLGPANEGTGTLILRRWRALAPRLTCLVRVSCAPSPHTRECGEPLGTGRTLFGELAHWASLRPHLHLRRSAPCLDGAISADTDRFRRSTLPSQCQSPTHESGLDRPRPASLASEPKRSHPRPSEHTLRVRRDSGFGVSVGQGRTTEHFDPGLASGSISSHRRAMTTAKALGHDDVRDPLYGSHHRLRLSVSVRGQAARLGEIRPRLLVSSPSHSSAAAVINQNGHRLLSDSTRAGYAVTPTADLGITPAACYRRATSMCPGTDYVWLCSTRCTRLPLFPSHKCGRVTCRQSLGQGLGYLAATAPSLPLRSLRLLRRGRPPHPTNCMSGS